MFLRGGECRRRQLPGHEMFLVAEVLCSLPPASCSKVLCTVPAMQLLCITLWGQEHRIRSGVRESHVILYHHSCERASGCTRVALLLILMVSKCTVLLYMGGGIPHASSSRTIWKELQVTQDVLRF